MWWKLYEHGLSFSLRPWLTLSPSSSEVQRPQSAHGGCGFRPRSSESTSWVLSITLCGPETRGPSALPRAQR